jgi:hypothetical protein
VALAATKEPSALSERQSQQTPEEGRPGDDIAGAPGRGEDPRAVAARRREQRIRRLQQLVRDADYDVPSDEVAARIIRDALFGAPDADDPS